MKMHIMKLSTHQMREHGEQSNLSHECGLSAHVGPREQQQAGLVNAQRSIIWYIVVYNPNAGVTTFYNLYVRLERGSQTHDLVIRFS